MQEQADTFFAPALPRKSARFSAKQLARLDMGLEDRMKTRIGLLSGGQRQAVTLLMATINTPRVLLLDESHGGARPGGRGARAAHHAGHRGGKSHHDHDGHAQHRRGLSLGTRTIMLERGRIVLDLSGETRDRLDVPGLLCAVPRGVRRGAR